MQRFTPPGGRPQMSEPSQLPTSTRCSITPCHTLNLLIIITPLDTIHVRQGSIHLLLSDIRLNSHGKRGLYLPHHFLRVFRHVCRTMKRGWYAESLQWAGRCQQVDERLFEAPRIPRVRAIGFGGPSAGSIECLASPATSSIAIVFARIRLFILLNFCRRVV